MDTFPLVNEQLEDGKKLIEQLAQAGFEVTAAFWLNPSADGGWLLGIVSPVVDREGSIKAYKLLHPVLFGMPQPFGIDPLAVRLFSPESPVARAAVETLQRHGWRGGLHHGYGGRPFGSLRIEDVYLYPPPMPAEEKKK